ncbi:ubiquitin fusion degradation protein [Exophiala xenobiotica]|uniref:Ubiquitin fusion degradation protein n=1 Tax=Lithohypha guttulata TaxID=1690604 RepID=A0ABR0KHS1_9EURO|nr:ubiquitin fusion degradation protein [Lithohypha guttulata]KAK5316359.1 ubiquitin fusion degradation protein [Exophiala xenobiotica]
MSFYSDMGFGSRRPPVGMSMRRFDEYYRCYPVVMMSGPDRQHANYGGKIFLPASALEKLTRLHISYPMLFELTNGAEGKTGHAGVLEFVAEEGRVYLPRWLMTSLSLEPGDLIQVKPTDLPPGKFIKLQPQSPSFLDISDPRAVLENAFRNFSCLTKNDIFQFHYNDETYDIKVLEIKPENDRHAIVTMETDLEVDFATPLGYKPPERTSGTSTPRTAAGIAHGGALHPQGSMAQSINYGSIAPQSNTAADGAKVVSSHFLGTGNKLKQNKGKGSSAGTPLKSSTPVQGQSTNEQQPPPMRRTNGPQPLRLPPGKLFFGYEIKPMRKKDENGEPIADDEKKPKFSGEGQTLRGKK